MQHALPSLLQQRVSNPFRAGGEALATETATTPPATSTATMFQTPSERAVRRWNPARNRDGDHAPGFKPLQSGR